MYYLRTHVFSKQEKEFVETAMAFACDIHQFSITASTTTPSPRAVLPVRSILSISKRNKCRKLLRTSAGKAELSPKLWSRKRRRKLAAVIDNCRSQKLLFKLNLQQYNRFIRSRCAPDVSSFDESAKERQSTRDLVHGDRWSSIDRCLEQQSTFPSLSANGLCSGSASVNSRRRAASHRLPSLALERSLRSQRDPTRAQMSQRKRSHLRVLQSRSLESSIMSAR